MCVSESTCSKTPAPALANKRQLVANPAAVDAKLAHPTSSPLRRKRQRLIALFGPEHGVYGDAAGAKVDDAKDPRTGRMLYSLYGKSHRPTTQALKTIDAARR